jgi:hypothetical protein
LTKHDVAKWIGVYEQVLNLNKSGTSTADILRNTCELYHVKSKNNTNFMFEYCWVLVKDHLNPKWVDGWSVVKP